MYLIFFSIEKIQVLFPKTFHGLVFKISRFTEDTHSGDAG